MRKRLFAILTFTLLMALTYAWSQAPAESMADRFRRMSQEAEARGLADPFKGITTNGTSEQGIYSIRPTGVSTEPVRRAAAAFLAALEPEQRSKTMFPVDDVEWRKWMNKDFYIRQGVSFKEMSESQREAAFGMMRAALSAKGLQLSRDIMKLNYTLGELNNNDFVRYGEWAYWITMMGEPSKDRPWGWQMDGHHLIINYFVLGDQVVMTPLFVGSEPVIAPSGKYKGTTILQNEQNLGLKMVLALDDAQRKKAVLQVSKTSNNNLTEAFKDNVLLDYAGVRVSEFLPAQKKQLLGLISEYVSNMDDGHA